MSQGVAAPALSSAESARLARLEATVDRAVEVVGRFAGEALAAIRDERLYRATHASFEDYAYDRFGISRATAYRWIDAAHPPSRDRPERERAAQRVSPRDKPSTGDGESDEEERRPSAPFPASSERVLVGTVTAVVDQGRIVVAVELPETLPPVGARVQVTWQV